MKKYLSYLFIFILSFIILSPKVSAYYDKVEDTSLKIYDYGEYLTDEDEKELKKEIDNFIEKYNMDMVIVTKKNYNYRNMQDYAQDFYDYNGFGLGKTRDGILLFYNEDSEGPIVWMSTTGEGIRMYDDNRLDSMRYSMSGVKSSGVKAMLKTFIERADYYASKGIPSSNKYTYIDENGDLRRIRRYPYIGIFILSVVITGIVMAVLVSKNKTVHKATDAKLYLDSTSTRITGRSDTFVGTHTSKIRRPTETSSSGGRVGGSSISRGSSGISHGGRGGRL
jgi:uncharacterized protein